MDLAYLYSVYWNLFNVSLVWTDSHAPPERGPGAQSSMWEAGHRMPCGQRAKCREGEWRRNRTWTIIHFLSHAHFSLSFLILPPPSSFLFSYSSLSFPFLTGFLPCVCAEHPFTFFLFDLWMN